MSLDPGNELKIHSFFYYSKARSDICELVKLPLHELIEMEQDSMDKERAIYEKMCDLEKEWSRQANQTDLVRKAQQYLKVPPTSHTSNVWMDGEYGWHRISNMVYKMSWHVYENTRYDKASGKSIPVSWELSWHLTFNTPQNPDYSGPGHQIAGQEKRRFTDKAEMDKYLQGRIKAYAHLFTELSPPIPKGEERRFSVNGVLLPGYTVEVPEKTPQEVADELLGFLDADELETLAPDPQPEERSPQEIWEKHRKQHPGKSPGKRTPTR